MTVVTLHLTLDSGESASKEKDSGAFASKRIISTVNETRQIVVFLFYLIKYFSL